MRVYLAGALHSASQRQHLEMIAALLEQDHEVYLPHRDGGLYTKMVRSGTAPSQAARLVRAADCKAIDASDVLIAVTVGKYVTDPGVCFEIGYAVARGIQCVTYAPDLDTTGSLNPMISASLAAILTELTHLANLQPH